MHLTRARTATPADFGFPVPPEPGKPSSSSGKSSGKKRHLDPASETYQPDEEAEQEEQEEEEEEDVVFQQGDTYDSPEITIKHNVQLKKLATQCFCGKSGFKTPAEVEKHRLAVHTGHGKGVNSKTKRQRDYWQCNQCNEVSGDPVPAGSILGPTISKTLSTTVLFLAVIMAMIRKTQ